MVKKLCLLVFGLVFLCVGVSFADSELWSSNAFQHAFSKELKLNVIPEVRIKSDLSDLYYFQVYVGPAVTLSKNLELSAYIAPNFSKTGNTWNTSYYSYIDATYKCEFPWFVFSNRSRFEDNMTANVFKYRDQFLFTKFGVSMGDEFFFNFSKGFYDEGRSTASYIYKLNNDLSLSLGYLLRRQKTISTSEWKRTSVLTAGVKLQI